MDGEGTPPAGAKRDSTAATVFGSLALAVSFLALGASFVPYLSGVAVLLAVPGMLGAQAAMGVALLRRSRLLIPALALVVAAAPAARFNWAKKRIVWVESAEICSPPQLRGISLFALLGSIALSADYKNAVGNNICAQLGRQYDDSDCDGAVGRIRCE
jgi:hypothetical protein